MLKLAELREKIIQQFIDAGIERPSYVADLIVAKYTDIQPAHFVANRQTLINTEQEQKIIAAAGQRLLRVPLSYILGEAEFYGYTFDVGEGCLIPRPETELLVEEVLSLPLPDNSIFADWCTGSGCIALSILLERKNFRGYAVDCSSVALNWAERNTEKYSLNNRIKLILNEKPSAVIIKEKLDFITANPPYIPSDEMSGLMKDVREYEPAVALDGGKDGVELYAQLFTALPTLLKHHSFLAFETAGDNQIKLLIEMAERISPDLTLYKTVKDYSGISRHLIWQKN